MSFSVESIAKGEAHNNMDDSSDSEGDEAAEEQMQIEIGRLRATLKTNPYHYDSVRALLFMPSLPYVPFIGVWQHFVVEFLSFQIDGLRF